jgi:hypothetical protein
LSLFEDFQFVLSRKKKLCLAKLLHYNSDNVAIKVSEIENVKCLDLHNNYEHII